MEINQVRYFLALCEEQNFTRAAKRCGVSQPSLSNAIRTLEQELGGQLFHRGLAKCSISKLGELVRPYLADIEQSLRDVHIQAARFSANGSSAEKLRSAVDLDVRPPLLARVDEVIE